MSSEGPQTALAALDAIEVTYRAGRRDLVHRLSASFEAGRVHLIIGPNGAGKSTFVKLLSRLLRPTAGRVRYAGVDAADLRELDLARRRAVLSQAIDLAFPLSVREVVMMGRYPHFRGRPSRRDEAIRDEVLQFFDVEPFADRAYPTLSGGEQQRVNFARVLAQIWEPVANGCRYLFLDEPLTFLDIRHQIDFMKKVRRFAETQDVVTIGVVHDLTLAARFADRLILMRDGGIVAQGASDQVLTRDLIREVFEVTPSLVPATDGRGVHLVFE
jgi:iron complex transport system ATP-binding protein